MKVCFIVNPVSGPRPTRDGRCERLERLARLRKVECTIRLTDQRGHADDLARQAVAEGMDRVISVGGDGTMNEVAGCLVNTGVPLGLVPLGSGNGLARDLGLPLDFDRAVVVALEGSCRTIDSGSVNGKRFFNVMGAGFDAELGRRFNATERRGFATYLQLGLRTYVGYPMQRYRVEPGTGESVEFRAFLLSVANSTQYGNGARIAPRARLDDGQLNLVAVTTGNPLHALGLVTRLFTGSVDRSHRTINLVGSRFRVRRERPGPVHTDGEIHDLGTDLLIETHPASIRVATPG